MSHKKIFHTAPLYSVVATPTLSQVKAAEKDFVDSIRTENGHHIFSPEAEGDKWAHLDGRCIDKLLEANSICFRALQQAESKSRTNLIAGLAGGAALTTSILGITSLVRRRKNQRRNGSK